LPGDNFDTKFRNFSVDLPPSALSSILTGSAGGDFSFDTEIYLRLTDVLTITAAEIAKMTILAVEQIVVTLSATITAGLNVLINTAV